MGRRKRKQLKPWCWYCNREFEDEKILIQHQKAKHFKCPFCHKKLFTGPGLSIHCNQVHKEKLDKIPNALPNRSSTIIDIYGMSGIPEADILDHERQKFGIDDEPLEKVQCLEDDYIDNTPILPPLPQFPFVPSLPSIMPYGVAPIPPNMPIISPNMMPIQPPPPPPPPPPPQFPEPGSITPEAVTPKATFPAYSASDQSKGPTPKIIRPSTGANGVKVELVYMDDDLSLEELRAESPKYKEALAKAINPSPSMQSMPLSFVPNTLQPNAVPTITPPLQYFGMPRPIAICGPSASFVPLHQHVVGVPGFPQHPALHPAWMGMPNVRF